MRAALASLDACLEHFFDGLAARIRKVAGAVAAPVRKAWSGLVEAYGVGHATALAVLAVLAMGGVVIALVYWVRVLLPAGSL